MTELYWRQKQPPEVFYEKNILKNFAKLTGKQLCQNIFYPLNFEKVLRTLFS